MYVPQRLTGNLRAAVERPESRLFERSLTMKDFVPALRFKTTATSIRNSRNSCSRRPQVVRTAMRFAILVCLISVSCHSMSSARPPSRPGAGHPPRQPDRIREGDPAPDFKLTSPDGKRTVRLADWQGKRPVALVFGSYT